jgi:anti-sigma B factor antagonist
MLKTQVEHVGTVTIVSLAGKLNASTSESIQDSAEQLARTERCILLDLSDVTYLSSAGLRVLLLMYRYIRENQGNVALIGLTEDVHDVMEITGFLDLFTVYYSRDEGIREFEKIC